MHEPRRKFMKAVSLGGGGLLIGFALPSSAARFVSGAASEPGSDEVALTPWVRITADNQITILLSQAEIGQGISTTLPAILADELGADWAAVRLAPAPFSTSATAYRNPKLNWMFTGNSESIESFYDLMRKVGATAREMLIRAAATRWSVEVSACSARSSMVVHEPTGRALSFGELAHDAAGLSVPSQPRLKPDRELKLVGRALPKVDVPAKVDGSAIFGIDFALPGMLVAAIRTAPAIGGTLRSVDETAIRAKPGVRGVARFPDGVAVAADTYWQARTALLAGNLEFDSGPNAGLDSAGLEATYRNALDGTSWVTPVNQGNAEALLQGSARVHTRDYQNPFLAHATMEPMNCTASVTPERCEIWAPTQGQELAFEALKQALGMPGDRIVVNRTPYAGGGFGRRLVPDFVVRAALVSKAIGKPMKLIWDREEDIRHDWYRPATMVRLSAAVDAGGLPSALVARVVSPTILLPAYPPIRPLIDKGMDPSALEGMMETRYAIPARKVDFHLLQTAVPTSVMRTTGYGPNIFALESFIDELAHAAKADPYLYRRRLLANDKRAVAVLDRAAQSGHWDKPLGKGRGRGIAFTDAFGTLFAQVVEVEVKGDSVRVVRIASAVDPGRTLDPGIAANNIEGGVIFGLSYCKSEITFKAGRAEQDNFNTYEMPYLWQAPQLVTEFIESGEKLGGIGEVSPVLVPPALGNAIFAATGRRLRSMPLGRHGLRFA